MHALLGDAESSHASRVEAWVEGSLSDMPELLRLGVLGESLLVMIWRRLRPRRTLTEILRTMERNPVGLIQQYPRLFRSLVLFGDLESAPATR
jgi:hypothetical protein